MTDFKVFDDVKFIENRRLTAIPKLSLRKVATKANISHTKWQQVTHGYKLKDSQKIQLDEVPANIVAQMAYAVDIKPEEISQLNREASKYLEKIYKGEVKLYLGKKSTEKEEYYKFLNYLEDNLINNTKTPDMLKRNVITAITNIVDGINRQFNK